jgi:exodeoxyribonuclease-3
MRVISLNLNGIRSAAGKGLYPWLENQNADLVCLQELKAQAADLSPEMLNPPKLAGYFHHAEKKGYSGVGIYTRHRPDRIIEGLGIPDIDAEGRYLEAQFGNLSLISLYLPSGSSSEERQAAKFVSWNASCPTWKSSWPAAGKSSCAATGTSPTGKST